MGEFFDAVIRFPTVLFSVLLIATVAFWLLVVLSGLGADIFDGDVDVSDGAESAMPAGFAGFMASIGLGGVPVSVPLSLLIAVGWFVSLAANALVDGLAAIGPAAAALGVAVLVVALVCGWLVTRVLVAPLRRLFPEEDVPTRRDFVGRTCVIRTGRVGRDFGQAEVTAADGSSAVVQVRQTGEDPLRAGSTALIFEYDADGEFFWVMPYDAELDPDRPAI